MSGNKTALGRYRVIDRCLRLRPHSKKELIHEIRKSTGIAISDRAFDEDLYHLRHDPGLGFYAPIIYDRAERGYRYTQAHYRIAFDPLPGSRVDRLIQALQILENVLDDTQIEEVWQDMRVLLNSYSGANPEMLQKVMEIETSPNLEAVRWLDSIRKAIRLKHTITITYKPFDIPEPYLKTLSPYYLKRYNQRWMLIAWDHDLQKFRHFGLDRIMHIQPSLQEYTKHAFDGKAYFRDVVGLTIPENVKKTEIRFEATSLQGEYIRTKPFHTSIRLIDESPRVWTFVMSAIPNFELEQKFLSFGEHVRVIAPRALQRKLAQRLTKAVKHYQKDKQTIA